MDDLKIYQNIEKCLDHNLELALVTIVKSRGSTPRKAGAKMITLPDGQSFGTIGGGCVEGEIRKKAMEILHQTKQTTSVTNYLNDKVGVEDGDICGGSITVLIEYLASGLQETEPQ